MQTWPGDRTDNVRIGRFSAGGQTLLCVAAGGSAVPVDEVLVDHGLDPANPAPMLARLSELEPALRAHATTSSQSYELDGLVPRPLLRPQHVVLAVGNFAQRGADGGPARPAFHLCSGSAVSGALDSIVRPRGERSLDYEGELAVVIGTGGREIDASAARAHIAGYLVANDVTAHDAMDVGVPNNAALTDIMAGKSRATFCPISPWLVTADEIADPQALEITTRVNGELRQSASTAQMLMPIDELVAAVSRVVELLPGDLILTGTPAGTGRERGEFLADVDRVRVEVAGVGVVDNVVTTES